MKKQPHLLWWSMCLESSGLWPVASLEAFLLPIPMELLLASSRIHFSNNNRCDCEKSELMTWYRSSRDKYWRHLLIWFNKKRSGSRFGKIGDWDPLGRSFSFFEAETLRSYLNGWQKSRTKENWLVVSTHLKHNILVKMGNVPQIGVKIKHIWNHHLEDNWLFLDLFRMICNWPHQKVIESAPSSDH